MTTGVVLVGVPDVVDEAGEEVLVVLVVLAGCFVEVTGVTVVPLTGATQ